MINITELPGYPKFKEECKYFFCKNPDVYGPDWSGTENYIIASELSEATLVGKYPEIMRALSPYLYCDAACGEAIADGMRNTQKFQKRETIYTHYSLDEDFEQDYLAEDEISCSSTVEIVEMRMMIDEALKHCTAVEKERIINYYYYGMTLEQIADGKAIASIWESINTALKKIQKKMSKLP